MLMCICVWDFLILLILSSSFLDLIVQCIYNLLCKPLVVLYKNFFTVSIFFILSIFYYRLNPTFFDFMIFILFFINFSKFGDMSVRLPSIFKLEATIFNSMICWILFESEIALNVLKNDFSRCDIFLGAWLWCQILCLLRVI